MKYNLFAIIYWKWKSASLCRLGTQKAEQTGASPLDIRCNKDHIFGTQWSPMRHLATRGEKKKIVPKSAKIRPKTAILQFFLASFTF